MSGAVGVNPAGFRSVSAQNKIIITYLTRVFKSLTEILLILFVRRTDRADGKIFCLLFDSGEKNSFNFC